ncbi:MAG: TIGR00341 family protein [Anaerolineales bacterium]|nr:TIGR00341 family protein [Anaerolineales bacterium]
MTIVPANELPNPESYYAMRVVVPIANPHTAPALINFAATLTHPTKGKIKAVYVFVPNSPFKGEEEALAEVVKRAKERGLPIEFLTVKTTEASRGVLDVTREQNADLLVLGYQAPKDGKIVIGAVVESIARVVPTDLIVYRRVEGEGQNPKRIIVPITTFEGSRVAMIHALHIAEKEKLPVMALFVRGIQSGPRDDDDLAPFWLQRARIYDAIYELPGGEQIDTEVIHAADLVAGVKQISTEDDLIILSVEQPVGALDRWLFGVTSQKCLRLAPGSVALVRRAPRQFTTWQLIQRQIARWTPTLTVNERTDVIQQAVDLTRANTNFIVMIILSSVLASVGLLQSSPAVIIGAMLVAPLMSPLMGFGVGLAIAEIPMMRRSVWTVIQGVGMVIGASALLGLVFPLPTPTPEMLARGQPTFLDMMVAIASGAAGAFAMARRDIPAALAGVAIAAALVPPICTTGLAMAMGEFDLMVGAAALVLVNIVCISITSATIFAILGVQREGQIPLWQRLSIAISILGLLALPLMVLLRHNYVVANAAHETEVVIEESLDDARIMDIEVSRGDPMEIVATVQTSRLVSRPLVNELEATLEERLNRDVALDVIILRVVRAEDETSD